MAYSKLKKQCPTSLELLEAAHEAHHSPNTTEAISETLRIPGPNKRYSITRCRSYVRDVVTGTSDKHTPSFFSDVHDAIYPEDAGMEPPPRFIPFSPFADLSYSEELIPWTAYPLHRPTRVPTGLNLPYINLPRHQKKMHPRHSRHL
jgi:hypothetical protein